MSFKPFIVIVTQEEYTALLQTYTMQLRPYLICSLRELLSDISKRNQGDSVRCSVIVQRLAQSESLRVPKTPLDLQDIPPRSAIFVVDIHTGLIRTKHIIVNERL